MSNYTIYVSDGVKTEIMLMDVKEREALNSDIRKLISKRIAQ